VLVIVTKCAGDHNGVPRHAPSLGAAPAAPPPQSAPCPIRSPPGSSAATRDPRCLRSRGIAVSELGLAQCEDKLSDDKTQNKRTVISRVDWSPEARSEWSMRLVAPTLERRQLRNALFSLIVVHNRNTLAPCVRCPCGRRKGGARSSVAHSNSD